MNFLAHAYLSFDHPEVLVGNFIGDFVKGDLYAQFVPEIVMGIKLHREIDRFTDLHPLVKESQLLLKPVFARYSSVITDMFFDYFLAKNWHQHHTVPLEEFAENTYRLMEAHRNILPKKFSEAFKYMQKENWLVAYGTAAGIKRALTGISYRTTFKSNLEKAPYYLEKHHSEFEGYFNAFFPELTIFSENKLKELKTQLL
ncbi:acyl carrier protein phosphodiesterase [Lunatimonas lonarensis]|uniref:acyl carrier protein phosphodiesterase n=1 Tax=Lunatimonas lonarensis TaxID=1232681 RepID=UPI0004B50C2D|nr:ACP phosphodiesterase [Lunatimonas lonarensis]